MKLSVLRRVAALVAVSALAFTLSACYQQPGGVLPNNTPTTEHDPIPTLPAKEGQMTLSLLLGVMKADMKWSQISSYNHTDVDDTHATFDVADNYGKECTLSVTYDPATAQAFEIGEAEEEALEELQNAWELMQLTTANEAVG